MIQSARKWPVGLFLFFTSFFSTSAYSMEFEPGFELKLGVSGAEFQSFEIEGEKIKNFSFGSISLEYQFTEDWAASLLVAPTLEGCVFFCDAGFVNDDGDFVRVDYEANLYQLTAVYSPQVSEHFSWLFNAGLAIMDEDINVLTCEYDGSLFDGCDRSQPFTNDDRSDTQFGIILGAGMNFQFNKNWGAQLMYNYGDVREGYNQLGLSFSYKF